MASLRASEAGLNWRAAALLGLISSTFSTLMSQLISARIGRDAAVDWMVVAAIPLRDPILQSDPTWTGIIGGDPVPPMGRLLLGDGVLRLAWALDSQLG